ncbi:MAG: bifunctional oligoribonuclease/PAP phosphatase NrnA [Bacilli bacterium]
MIKWQGSLCSCKNDCYQLKLEAEMSDKMITKKIWQEIKKAESIVIFRHIKPDGDAYGAQMGLKELITFNFPTKKVYCAGEISSHWSKIMGDTDTDLSDEIIKQSLVIILDVANKARIDDQRFLFSSKIIKIDHHIFVEEFGGIEWVDTSSMATCEMITKMAFDNNAKIDSKAATNLYCGIVTDSGRFLFSNTTSQTLIYAAKLIDKGVDINSLYSFIYENTEKEVRFKGYCQLNYKTTEHGVAYMFITTELRKQFNINENYGAGSVNVLSNIEGVNIHVFFSEKEDGKVKVELRSKALPVNIVATKYGGGGHKLASGAIVPSWEVAEQLLKDLDDLCKESAEHYEALF